MYESIPSDAALAVLDRVVAFRARPARRSPRDETAELLSLFPHVGMRGGFVLDYAQETTASGVNQPIHPFARPVADDGWVPLFDEDVEREDLVDQLYQYLHYEPTPMGLFEYAFFVIELWSLRLSRHAADWLESTPIFTAAEFDRVVESASHVNEAKRPDGFAPQARRDPAGGGRVRFLVHTTMGWDRIYYLESLVFADGFVEQEAGEILVDMGSGLVF